MTEVFEQTPGLVRIRITAADMATAQEAAKQISQLWLSSSYRPRRVPGKDGVHVQVDADLRRRPEDGGIAALEDDGGPGVAVV
ncbi:DUF6207 family protein [Streptomyces sp. NPDC012637]|uniref:DUF6207 family protein n=1 Tax=Streptomyces sp. NPDC012637 TaxID=3364842 RepID=UPI0036E9C64D